MTNFYYYNINPNRDIEGDCVTRAISIAGNIPYRSVSKLLKMVAEEHNCDELCVYCYHHLLEDVLGYKIVYPKDKKTVGEIAKDFSNNIIIVRIDGHLTACMYGVCVDIWDCTNEIADCFWIVK